MHQSDQLIREIMNIGVGGYLSKSDADRDLILAVENLAIHKTFYTAQVTEVLLGRYNSGEASQKVPDLIRERLTSREREMVQLIADGKRGKDIASSLGISVKTAERHRVNLMRKLKIHTVSEVVLYALRNQIVES